MVPKIPMIGIERDGATVVADFPSDNTGLAQYVVRCACGEHFIRRGSDIRRGKSLRCRSCTNSELSRLATRHGESRGYLFKIWENMQRRCYDPGMAGFFDIAAGASRSALSGAIVMNLSPPMCGIIWASDPRVTASTALTMMGTMSRVTSGGPAPKPKRTTKVRIESATDLCLSMSCCGLILPC